MSHAQIILYRLYYVKYGYTSFFIKKGSAPIPGF